MDKTAFFRLLLVVSALSGFSNFAGAEELINSSHGLALQWQRMDEALETENQNFEFQVNSLSLSYRYQLDSDWGISVSVRRGGDELELANGRALEKQLSAFSIDASYRFTPHWLMYFGFAGEKNTTELHSRNANLFYQDETESKFLFASLGYDAFIDDFSISPSLGLSYQDSQFDRLQNRQILSEQTDGIDASLSVNMAYLLESQNQSLWLPALTLGWSETLSGTVESRALLASGGQSNRFRRLSNSEENSQHSGFMALSLAAYWDAYFADISTLQTFTQGERQISLALQLGLDF